MRGLAEYAMHGRRQAIIVILLTGFLSLFLSVLYFFSAAVVALVALRKGTSEGLIMLLWALLPATLVWQAGGDITPMLLMPGTLLLSLMLRRTESWQPVIITAMVIGLLAQLSLTWQPGYVSQFETVATEIVNAQLEQGAQVQYSADQLLSWLKQFYGAYHAMGLVICLVLARWWQAMLYKPGGFREEFHRLQFDTRVMLVILGLVILSLMGVPLINEWLAVLVVPPLIGGIALMHGVVGLRQLGSHWLVLGYLVMLMMSPAIIAMGFFDSVFDFRKRIRS